LADTGTTYYYVRVTNTITDNGDGGAKSRYTASSVAVVHVALPNLIWNAIPAGTAAGTSTFGTSEISKIAWGGPAGSKKFVAVGWDGKMAYSADGVNWTAIPAGTGAGQSRFTSYIYDIAWGGTAGNEKFVAVGHDGRMAYSADGVTWTAISATSSTFGTSNHIRSIAWGGTAGNEKFVAGGDGARMAYSANGITWTFISAASSTFDNTLSGQGKEIRTIAWGGTAGNEKFVAGGQSQLAYSTDGINWVDMDAVVPYSVHFVDVIAWGGPAGNEKFIFGGYYGYSGYSADGITWSHDMDFYGKSDAMYLSGIAWGGTAGNEKFVVGGAGGPANMAYSTDGVTWKNIPVGTTVGTTTFSGGEINAIVWGGTAGNEKFVAVGKDGRMAWSTGEVVGF
jgi:hypothetical protein